jgi:hypothetical protein
MEKCTMYVNRAKLKMTVGSHLQVVNITALLYIPKHIIVPRGLRIYYDSPNKSVPVCKDPSTEAREQQRPQLRLQEQLLLQHSCSGKENFSEAASMVGLQSQWRGGSIKNCKKRAVKLKIRSFCRNIAKQHKKNITLYTASRG